MWTTVGRIVVVFIVWGALLGLAIAAGAPSARAETLAGLGAGFTFFGWAALLQKGRAPSIGAKDTALPEDEEQQRRASG